VKLFRVYSWQSCHFVIQISAQFLLYSLYFHPNVTRNCPLSANERGLGTWICVATKLPLLTNIRVGCKLHRNESDRNYGVETADFARGVRVGVLFCLIRWRVREGPEISCNWSERTNKLDDLKICIHFTMTRTWWKYLQRCVLSYASEGVPLLHNYIVAY
jgi:hypothetical protein